MPTQSLPNHPSLQNLRKQAKSLRKAVHDGDANAISRVREFHPRSTAALKNFRLNDAQLVVARTYEFDSWSKLKAYVEMLDQHSFMPPHPRSVTSEPLADQFVRFACLDYLADHAERRERARKLLAENPSVARENIYTATAVGDVAAVKEMLEQNPRLATLRGGPHNWEPLLYAAYSRLNSESSEHSTLEVAKLLLDHRADPNAGFLWDGHYVFTALTGAFGEGESGPVHQPEHQYCYELAQMLLNAGADPNDSQTLYNRMFTGGTRHLELLFEFGLGKSDNGVWFKRLGERLGTPAEMLQQQMGWAAKYNQLDRMKLLIDHGVDVNGTDTRLKQTAYELAQIHGHKEIAQLLLQHGATPTTLTNEDAFASACLTSDESRAQSLFSANPSLLRQLGSRRAELLQLAAERDNQPAIRLMVRLGFDLNEVSRTTALHNAAMAGHLEMVKLLIELGADPSIHDTEFDATPQGWALYGGHDQVAAFLESAQSSRDGN